MALVPFSNMPAFTVQLYYKRIPGLFIQICVFIKASGLLQIHHYAYMEGAAPTGLKNLLATILDAILNMSNAE